MHLAHFYHVYAAGEWRGPVGEHLYSLDAGGFSGTFHVGLVGSPRQRAEVVAEVWPIRQPDEVVNAEAGWEQVTLTRLHAWARAHPADAVLYAHSKGAGHPAPFQGTWRRSMAFDLVYQWRRHLAALDEYDAVGCHYLRPGVDELVTDAHFAGNYWLATCAYLAALDPPASRSRYDAEWWIGTGNPHVLDLRPGRPPYNLPRHPAHRIVTRPPV